MFAVPPLIEAASKQYVMSTGLKIAIFTCVCSSTSDRGCLQAVCCVYRVKDRDIYLSLLLVFAVPPLIEAASKQYVMSTGLKIAIFTCVCSSTSDRGCLQAVCCVFRVKDRDIYLSLLLVFAVPPLIEAASKQYVMSTGLKIAIFTCVCSSTSDRGCLQAVCCVFRVKDRDIYLSLLLVFAVPPLIEAASKQYVMSTGLKIAIFTCVCSSTSDRGCLQAVCGVGCRERCVAV